MQRTRCRQWFCICMALLFAIGILGCSIHVKKLPGNFGQMEAESIAITHISTDSFYPAERLLPVGMLQKIDDFQIAADAEGTNASIQNGIRRMPLVLAAAIVLLLFVGISPRQRHNFGEKRIRAFFIVSFIHRKDGKKRSCFEIRRKIKTGGC